MIVVVCFMWLSFRWFCIVFVFEVLFCWLCIVCCVCVVVFVVVCLWLRVRGCVGCVLCSRLYVVVCVLRVCVCGCVLAVV